MEPPGDSSGDREQAAQKDLRKRIMEVQRDSSLAPAEKAKKIQEMMTANWQQSQRKKEAEEESDPSGLTTAEEADTFHDKEKTILGCKHYMRKAKIKAACCGKLFPCRLCHDDQVKDHKIDRYATEYMFCMLCKKLGEFGKNCQHCGETMASYHCGVCKFLSGDPTKQIYHCTPCGLCRIGTPGVDTNHCDACGVCMAIERYNDHKHIDRQLHSDCPICGGYMFTSTQPVTYLPCSHAMHGNCFRQHLRSHTTCPICFKSAVDMSSYWHQLDALVARVPMPAEYQSVLVDILCNDCGTKSQDLKFHFYGVKCPGCSCYNTRILATRGYDPTASAGAATTATATAVDQPQEIELSLEQLEAIMDDALREFDDGSEDEEDDEDDLDDMFDSAESGDDSMEGIEDHSNTQE